MAKYLGSEERKDLVDDLGRIFKEPLQVKDPITL